MFFPLTLLIARWGSFHSSSSSIPYWLQIQRTATGGSIWERGVMPHWLSCSRCPLSQRWKVLLLTPAALANSLFRKLLIIYHLLFTIYYFLFRTKIWKNLELCKGLSGRFHLISVNNGQCRSMSVKDGQWFGKMSYFCAVKDWKLWMINPYARWGSEW